MPLTTCADCGREISSLAPACIHCGRPAARNADPPAAAVPAAPTPAVVAATPSSGCPLCGAVVTHPDARTGGAVWCERCGAQLIFGIDGALVRAVPRASQPQPQPQMQPASQVVIVGNTKSVGGAILLAFFFGPLGMLYSTASGAFIMFLASLFALVATLGMGLFITWPICMIWAGVAASDHNRRLTYGVNVLG